MSKMIVHLLPHSLFFCMTLDYCRVPYSLVTVGTILISSRPQLGTFSAYRGIH
jgi:hypothetical protein